MALPPDFRDLEREKTSKALEFASFKNIASKGISSYVGAGKPPVTPTNSPTPTETPTLTPTITPSVTETPTLTPTVTPTLTPTISLTPSITPTTSLPPVPLTTEITGVLDETVNSNGVQFTLLTTGYINSGYLYFNDNVFLEFPTAMDLYLDGFHVASIVFDGTRIGTPFAFSVDQNVLLYGNFGNTSIYFNSPTE